MAMRNTVSMTQVSKVFPASRRILGVSVGSGRAVGVTALREVDLTLVEGEVVGLVGPNGAGKSTLLRLLLGVLRPSSGEIRVLDHRPGGCQLTSGGGVGWVTREDRSFNLRLTGRDNLLFFAGLHDLWGGKARERVREVLRLVGLSEHADRPYRTYSSGMKQLLGFARAFLIEPKLLLLDEATSGLDPGRRERFFALLLDHATNGATVLVATHDPSELARLCRRVVLLDQGRVCIDGSMEEAAASFGAVFQMDRR